MLFFVSGEASPERLFKKEPSRNGVIKPSVCGAVGPSKICAQ